MNEFVQHHLRHASHTKNLKEVLEKVAEAEETGPAARPRDYLYLLPKLTLGQ